MLEKKEFLRMVDEIIQSSKKGEQVACPCPATNCNWHNSCYECVLLHRVNHNNLPYCLVSLLDCKAADVSRLAKTCAEINAERACANNHLYDDEDEEMIKII